MSLPIFLKQWMIGHESSIEQPVVLLSLQSCMELILDLGMWRMLDGWNHGCLGILDENLCKQVVIKLDFKQTFSSRQLLRFLVEGVTLDKSSQLLRRNYFMMSWSWHSPCAMSVYLWAHKIILSSTNSKVKQFIYEYLYLQAQNALIILNFGYFATWTQLALKKRENVWRATGCKRMCD